MSDPAPEILVDDPSPALAAIPAGRRPGGVDITAVLGCLLNDEWHYERGRRAAARAADAAGDTPRAIAEHAAADERKWRAECIEAALTRLLAMEPYEDKVRDLIKAERAKDAKRTAAAARPRAAARRSA